MTKIAYPVSKAIIPVTGAGLAGTPKPISIGAVGDSITANGWPNFDLYNGGSPPNSSTITPAYTTDNKCFSLYNFMLHASLRSNGAFFPFEFAGACSGATTAQIMGRAAGWAGFSPLDVFLGRATGLPSPYGLPAMTIILAGTNDYFNGWAESDIIKSVANVEYGWEQLALAGTIPIAMTIPPNNNNTSGSYSSTFDRQAYVERFNWYLARRAAANQIVLADIWSDLVNVSNGQYANAAYTSDGTHPTALAAMYMGYRLYQSLIAAFTAGLPKYAAAFNDTVTGYRSQDPGLLSITGLVDSASSYPNSYSAPGTPAMSTMNSGAGSEPGIGLTMAQTPALAGQSAIYRGYSWALVGDGVHSVGGLTYNNSPYQVNCAVGDKLAVMFRLKFIPAAGVHADDFQVGILNGPNGHKCFGILGPAAIGKTDNVQIGSETGYPAGQFYGEYTVNAASLGGGSTGLTPYIQFGTTAGSTPNSGAALVIADPHTVNLTQEGIV